MEMDSDPMMIKTPPKEAPRLFIGGPWHGRVERIPADANSWRALKPGGGSPVLYHRHVIVLSPNRAISAFVVSGISGGSEPDGWKVADAIAIAIGKSVGLMVAGE